MTTADRAIQPPAPRFSVWSPVVAVLGALVANYSPGWLAASVWALAVLCALPFAKFRLVVPLALLAWAAGWLVSFMLRLTEGVIVGLFVK